MLDVIDRIALLVTDTEWWKYLSIPIVAALVGWSTNWVAIQMLFYPVKAWGKPPFLGWQGILPSKAARMGAITVDTTLSKLGSLRDVFQTMDPQRIADHLRGNLEPRIEAYVEWVMLEDNPRLWKSLPGFVKARVYSTVRQELPEAIDAMMAEIGERVDEVVDIKDVVVNQLVADPTLVNKIFLECGKVEFAFIVRSGLYFGLPFGLIQMAIWAVYPAWWILPFFGILVGYMTNWIALRIIFQPLRPRRVGPFLLHGLFLRRQEEVSEIWCAIVSRDIITIHNIIHEMLYGRRSDTTQQIIGEHIKALVDKAIGIARPVIRFTLGSEEYEQIKHLASEKAVAFTSNTFHDREFSEERAVLVKELMRERMVLLSSAEFQNLLRPAFQEDEFKLILLGAVLGMLAGLGQLYFIFGGV